MHKLRKVFKDKNIDVLSHINVYSNNLILGKKSSVKTLSLIADFQHHYLQKTSLLSKEY